LKTVNVVAALIINQDKVFATQRGYGEFKDGWEFPGGKIEPGKHRKRPSNGRSRKNWPRKSEWNSLSPPLNTITLPSIFLCSAFFAKWNGAT
jgi:hypothetical protein